MGSLYEHCLAHWKLNENAADTTVADSRGTNSGTAQQNTSVLTTAGKVGGGLTFNGSSDYIAITDPSQIDVTAAPLSIFGWIYPSAASPQNGYVICKNLDDITNIQYALYWNITNTRLILILENTVMAPSADDSVPTGQWSFIGFTWDGTNFKYFVNGSQSGDGGTYTGSLTSRANCCIGRRVSATYFKGSLDDIMLFNKALTQEEITFLYNGGFGTEHLDFPQYKIPNNWSW